MQVSEDADPVIQTIWKHLCENPVIEIKPFCKWAGVSHETLRTGVLNKSSPRLKNVRAILDALGLDLMVVPKDDSDVSTQG